MKSYNIRDRNGVEGDIFDNNLREKERFPG